MKKIVSMLIGLSLVLGTCAFAQETKKEETKKEGKKKGSKKKTEEKK
jgi:hypothetical protein